MSEPITIRLSRTKLAVVAVGFLLLQATVVLVAVRVARPAVDAAAGKPGVGGKEQHGGEGHKDEPGGEQHAEAHEPKGKERHGGEGHKDEPGGEVEGKIVLTPQAEENAELEVRTAAPGRIDVILEVPGEIALNANSLVHVTPRVDGVVREIRKWAGNVVRKGDVLAVLDSRELAELQKNALASEERLKATRAVAERADQLWKENLTSQEKVTVARYALQEAEIVHRNALRNLEQLGVTPTQRGYEIVAPISGTIIQQHIGLGERLEDTAQAFVISDLSTIWVNATIYARDLSKVRVNQTAVVRGEGVASQAVGTITYVDPVVGEQTRSATARVVLKDPGADWKPGLFVTVQVSVDQSDAPLVVLYDAVQTVEGKDAVFVVTGEGFQAVPVKLGRRGGGAEEMVEVLGGLEPGTRYVSRNSFILKAEFGKSAAGHEH